MVWEGNLKAGKPHKFDEDLGYVRNWSNWKAKFRDVMASRLYNLKN